MTKYDAMISGYFTSLTNRITMMHELFISFNMHGANSEDLTRYRKSLAEAKRELQELSHNMTIKLREWDINE